MNKKLRGKAYAKVRRAIVSGRLTKSDECELCGRNCKHVRITGHHWNGHENALDVWWICQHCNMLLRDRHDGSLTKAEAKRITTKHAMNGFCIKCVEEKRRPNRVLVRHKG